MAQTDTQLQQLVINVGTEDQIAAGIASGTITEDMLSIATDGADITYDWVGTLVEYNEQNVATNHPDWLCFITDDVNNSGEDVYNNVYSKTTADEIFVAKTDGIAYLPNLLEFKWSDCILNNVSWLRADTFSWQSGSIYEAVYEHLLEDIASKTLQSETINGITIQYYEADDKHKICPASEENNIIALYNSVGVAWYYILDITNERFKLPRTKFGFTGLRDSVGKYIEPGLPNITGAWTSQYNISMDNNSTCKGAIASTYNTGTGYYGGSSASADWGYGFNFDASASNSIYGNSSTVQSAATEMYLYFYVGEFTQDAIINTAGITTEVLNNKADTDLLNTPMATADYVVEWQTPTSTNNYTWYRKYKSGWVEQGGKINNNSSTTTVNLPITMADTNYTLVGGLQNGTASTSYEHENFNTLTTTSFTFTTYDNYGVRWMVVGMAAA